MKVLRLLLIILAIVFFSTLSAEDQKVTIIHTNDLHSNILGYSPNSDYQNKRIGESIILGGWARIATIIKRVKKKRDNPVLAFDAGDFLISSNTEMSGLEDYHVLLLMNEMGYDVITFGNHEFDMKPRGLAEILLLSRNMGNIPEIVFSSAILSKKNSQDDLFESLYKLKIVKPYTVIIAKNIKIGIYGIIGKNASKMASLAYPIKFRSSIEVSKEMVKLLRRIEGVDIVICLSHSGIKDEDFSKPEDEILAKEVDGIDFIVSGHSHTNLLEPIIINDTIIVQAWEYGKHVGVCDVVYRNGIVKLKNYKIFEIDNRIQEDKRVSRFIEKYRKGG